MCFSVSKTSLLRKLQLDCLRVPSNLETNSVWSQQPSLVPGHSDLGLCCGLSLAHKGQEPQVYKDQIFWPFCVVFFV